MENELEILLEFLRYPLNTGMDILDRFSELSGAEMRVSNDNILESFVYVDTVLKSKYIFNKKRKKL